MKASLKNYRQAPRKVRLVARLVKGKKVSEALAVLSFTDKKASQPLKKLIKSASDNASNINQESPDNLIIKDIRVDKGMTLKRRLANSRGRASIIRKRASHVEVELSEKDK
ncbi:MAG TPA: 50S ribosomal protein L22 [Candidatus Vogelbacteria bacterium]|nr:50S ribosomal protein L22 [Candidatus Vogelbacteria bacterium]